MIASNKNLDEILLRRAPELIPSWLRGAVLKGDEWEVGSLAGEPGHSLKINVPKGGVWSDFKTGAKGGNLISLHAAVFGKTYRESAAELGRELGEAGLGRSRRRARKASSSRARLRAVFPVPEEAGEPPLDLVGASRNAISGVWLYRDAAGTLLGAVVRIDRPVKKEGQKPAKDILPLFYFPGGAGWRLKGHGHDREILYGLDRLAANPEKPVLLVEGEKTAEAAAKLFQDYVVISWMGGIGRLARVDFSALAGRPVTYWRDADGVGRESETLVIQMMKAAGASELRLVELPPDLPAGWDPADEAPAELDVHELLRTAEPVDLAAVEALQDLDYDPLVERLVYVVRIRHFIDPATGLRLEASHVNALFAHRFGPGLARRLLAEDRLRKLIGLVYRPGDPERFVTDKHGNRNFNLWISPNIEPVPGDPSTFVDHLRFLCTSDEEFEYLANFLAFMFQCPGQKLMWALVIVGKQGTGKSALIDILRILIGPQNTRLVSTTEIKSDFNEFLEGAQLVVVEEIMTGGRLEVMNKLKPYITQRELRVLVKYERPYEIENAANFVFLTNYGNALRPDKDDRRYFIIMNDQEPKAPAYYKHLYEWSKDNYGVILHWLLSRDLRDFDQHARPPMTAGKRHMIDASRPELDAVIEDAIRDRLAPFEHDLVDLGEVVATLRTQGMNNAEVTQHKVQTVLLRLGVRRLGQCKAWVERRDVRRSLWALRDGARYAAMSSRDALLAYLAMRPDHRPF